MPRSVVLTLVLGLVCLARPAGAQEVLTLEEALRRADGSAFANRIAAGATTAESGRAMAPYRGILPTVRLEGGYLRTTDPLNAFGFTLRQRAVTPAAFDPAALNAPEAVGNLMTGVVLEQPLWNADAWFGRRAAAHAREARQAQEQWTREGTVLEVTRAYWGAVLAGEQVAALETASEAARAHVRDADALQRAGLATRSDLLLASVRAGEVDATLLSARSEARLARHGLALAMGTPHDTTFRLPDSLPEPPMAIPARADSASTAGQRADVTAANAALAAASLDLGRARSLYLPRLNAFGRVDWNDPDTPFGGRSSWTVGMLLSWSPFAGASERAEIRMAAGQEASARAQAEAAASGAELERRRSRDAVEVSRQRLAIAERAVSQSQEAHRIVARKYEGGLATVSELLEAAATETRSVLGASAARYEVLVAQAELAHALGDGMEGVTR